MTAENEIDENHFIETQIKMREKREREREPMSTNRGISGHLLTNKHTQNKHTHHTYISTYTQKTLTHT